MVDMTNTLKIRDTSYLPYVEPIEQPANFKVELFTYQKKSVAKMLEIEKNEKLN